MCLLDNESFQRAINLVIEKLKFCNANTDDVIVFSNSWEENLGHLWSLLN